ncbi:FkbM family methyltransferase [Bauldia litoralis]|uniref:FkbM family methyltransferase n=1 Tax=Bauldia litoralis TaxID=665467 RepID=UPI003D65B9CA
MEEHRPNATDHVVRSGEATFDKSFYAYLGDLVPGCLFLDVGAASGGTCTAMLKYSPASHVIAFEPFPGNWPFFEKAHADDPRVDFRRCAVGAESGQASFAVARPSPHRPRAGRAWSAILQADFSTRRSNPDGTRSRQKSSPLTTWSTRRSG